MKLEETEKLKLQYVNNIQTTTSQINHINDSDTDLSEKKHQNFKHLREKTQLLKANYHSKNGVIIGRRYGHSIAECRQTTTR